MHVCPIHALPDVFAMIEADQTFACPVPVCRAKAGEPCKEHDAPYVCAHGAAMSHFGRRLIRIAAERRNASAHGSS